MEFKPLHCIAFALQAGELLINQSCGPVIAARAARCTNVAPFVMSPADIEKR